MDAINPFVVFEVKLDKDRGILVLTIRKEEKDDVCFFRFHHQPLNCHLEQVQQVIRSQKVTARRKSVKVNIYSFFSHYWNEQKKHFEFKGIKLNSTGQQMVDMQERQINKEIRLMNRREARETVTKEQKEAEKWKKLTEKYAEQEAQFQLRRAKRIAEAVQDIEAKKEKKIRK